MEAFDISAIHTFPNGLLDFLPRAELHILRNDTDFFPNSKTGKRPEIRRIIAVNILASFSHHTLKISGSRCAFFKSGSNAGNDGNAMEHREIGDEIAADFR